MPFDTHSTTNLASSPNRFWIIQVSFEKKLIQFSKKNPIFDGFGKIFNAVEFYINLVRKINKRERNKKSWLKNNRVDRKDLLQCY